MHAYLCTINPQDYADFHKKCDEFHIREETRHYLKDRGDVISAHKQIIKFDTFYKSLSGRSQNKLNFHKFLVIDCPTEKHVTLFKQRVAEMPPTELSDLDLIVHFSPSHIFTSKRYLRLFSEFNPKRIHNIYLNEKANNMTSKDTYVTQIFHHELNSSIFPSLSFDFHGKPSYKDNLRMINGKTSMAYRFASKAATLSDNRDFYMWQNVSYATIEAYHDIQSIAKFRLDDELIEGDETYPKIVFLGTSSHASSSIRNQSGILIKLCERESILLDCGQGVLGQFIRFFGEENYMRELVKVKALFISHAHLGHQTGMYSLANQRVKAFDALKLDYEKLVMIHPATLLPYIQTFNTFFANENIDKFVDFVDSDSHINASNGLIHAKCASLKRLQTAAVVHMEKSYGIAVETKNNVKIVYSGDCSPSEDLIRIGRDCHMLIHDATYSNEATELAAATNHSTKAQVFSNFIFEI